MEYSPIVAVKKFFSGSREVTTEELKAFKASLSEPEWRQFTAECQKALAASMSSVAEANPGAGTNSAAAQTTNAQ